MWQYCTMNEHVCQHFFQIIKKSCIWKKCRMIGAAFMIVTDEKQSVDGEDRMIGVIRVLFGQKECRFDCCLLEQPNYHHRDHFYQCIFCPPSITPLIRYMKF